MDFPMNITLFAPPCEYVLNLFPLRNYMFSYSLRNPQLISRHAVMNCFCNRLHCLLLLRMRICSTISLRILIEENHLVAIVLITVAIARIKVEDVFLQIIRDKVVLVLEILVELLVEIFHLLQSSIIHL